jgi:3-methyladenine DNA glycosylase AlkD
MNLTQVMRELKAMGTAQNRKVYGRHGVGSKMYGVSYANLGQLKKKIKSDHPLALKLWSSGNHDARILATMIAVPEEAKGGLLEVWAKDLDSSVLTDAMAGYAAQTRFLQNKMEKWSRSKQEWIGRAGWHMLAKLAMSKVDLPNSYFEDFLEIIERDIHIRKNRVRDAMNNALIAIGMRNSALEKKALAAAKKIGKVDVDHGETNCKTPDAASYIRKAKTRRKRRR